MSKLLVSKDLSFSQDKNKIKLMAEFCNFCADYLPIIDDFEIQVIDNRSKHGITTTAAYYIGENKCVIYGKNRAMVDIFRSICHEMVHMMQDEKGELIGHIQDAGGYHEDQANALAGELIKRFVSGCNSRGKIYESKNIKII